MDFENTMQSAIIHTWSVQLLSRVQLFAVPWTAACQASLCITQQSIHAYGHMSIC